jgi:hypothetical protein
VLIEAVVDTFPQQLFSCHLNLCRSIVLNSRHLHDTLCSWSV